MVISSTAIIIGLVLFAIVWRFASFVSGLISLLIFVAFYPVILLLAAKVFTALNIYVPW